MNNITFFALIALLAIASFLALVSFPTGPL
jgi:hypothetical protein